MNDDFEIVPIADAPASLRGRSSVRNPLLDRLRALPPGQAVRKVFGTREEAIKFARGALSLQKKLGCRLTSRTIDRTAWVWRRDESEASVEKAS